MKIYKALSAITVIASSFILENAAWAAPESAPPQVIGFWRTIDDKTGNAKSIVRLYECGNELCGRIVALYDAGGREISETMEAPVRISEKIKGSPHLAGMDIIWSSAWDGKEFSGGKIRDPNSGSVYSSLIWQTPEDIAANRLKIRGKIGPFGRTQTWHAVTETELPPAIQKLDTSKWSPKK